MTILGQLPCYGRLAFFYYMALNTAQISDYIKQNYAGLSTDPSYIQGIMNSSGGGDPSKISQAIQSSPEYVPYSANQAQQKTTDAQNSFNTNLTNTVNSLPTAQQTYTSLANTLGITPTQNALTGAISGENAITQKNNQQGGGFGMDAASIAGKNAQDIAPLNANISSLASTLGIENQNLGTLFQGQEQQNQNTLLPFQYQASQISQNATNTFNTWSQENQQQFQDTYSAIASGEQLTNAQVEAALQQANQLELYQQYPSLTGNSLTNPALLQALSGSLGIGSGGVSSGAGSGYSF